MAKDTMSVFCPTYRVHLHISNGQGERPAIRRGTLRSSSVALDRCRKTKESTTETLLCSNPLEGFQPRGDPHLLWVLVGAAVDLMADDRWQPHQLQEEPFSGTQRTSPQTHVLELGGLTRALY